MSDGRPSKSPAWFFDRLFSHKRLIIPCFAVAFPILLYLSSGIRLKEDIMDLLPPQDPVVKKHKTVLTGFRHADYMLIDIGPYDEETSVSQEELIRAADAFYGRISSSPLFEEIRYRSDIGDMSEALDTLKRHRASLFTEDDRRDLEKRLNIESIRETFNGWKKTLTESPAPFLSRSFYSDPLGMDAVLMKKIDPHRGFGGIEIEDGRIFSRDMKHILILAKPLYPGTDSRHAGELVDFMNKAAREAEVGVSPGKIHIAYMGSHRFGLDNSKMIKGDIGRTLSISFISIALLVLLVFRRPILFTTLTMLPAFFGGAFAMGVISVLRPDISAVSIGCGAMLMGIVVDFGIHFLYHVDQLPDDERDKRAITNILERLSLPILLTATTTLIAFLTLVLSVFPGYRQLGIFAALGITGAFGFAIIVLPLLIPGKNSSYKRAPVLRLTDIYPLFFKWSLRHRGILLLVAGFMTLAAASGLYRLEFEGDIRKLNAVFPETKRDWEIVAKSFGDTMTSTSITVTGKDLDEALRKNDLLYSELLRLQKQGIAGGNNSLSPILPDKGKQEENRRRWQKFWDKERTGRLIRDVEQVCRELRINQEKVKGALKELPGSMPALEMEDLESGFLRKITANQISVAGDNAMVLTNLKLRDEDNDYGVVAASVEKVVPGAVITGGRHFVQHVVHLIHTEMKRLGGITLLFVAIAMAFYAKRAGTLIRLLLPLLVSLFWTFGMMGWLGIKINIMNSIIVIFIFGVVDDYCVFLREAWEHAISGGDTHLSHTSGAITISALTTILGLGSLAFARHPALHTIGATALLGITSGLAAVFLLVPLLDNRRDVVAGQS